jgi:hypothetical protein
VKNLKNTIHIESDMKMIDSFLESEKEPKRLSHEEAQTLVYFSRPTYQFPFFPIPIPARRVPFSNTLGAQT